VRGEANGKDMMGVSALVDFDQKLYEKYAEDAKKMEQQIEGGTMMSESMKLERQRLRWERGAQRSLEGQSSSATAADDAPNPLPSGAVRQMFDCPLLDEAGREFTNDLHRDVER